MPVEEEHQDVLQNLEFAIISIYRQTPDLIDAEVLTAIEFLIRIYGAEAQGKTIASRPIRGISKEVAEAVQEMCELRLGRSPLPKTAERSPQVDVEGDSLDALPSISLDILVDCLKRIQSSIKFWSKQRGRQGYLDYFRQFIV